MTQREATVGLEGARSAAGVGQESSADWRPVLGALHRQGDELQTILDAVPAYIWFKDRDNRILRANRMAAQSMGTTPGELAGRSTYDLYPGEAAQYHRDDLEVICSGEPKLGIVEPLTTASGERRWVRTDKVPYRDAAGQVIGVLVFAVDISERVHAEEALQEARDLLEVRVAQRTAELASAVENLRREIVERERAEEKVRQQQAELAHLLRLRTVEGMAAQLAHEINQPLAAIVNFARGLARRLNAGALDTGAALRATEQIGTQAMRAADIVTRLRDFVRKEPPRRTRSSLEEIVQEAAALTQADARRHGVRLRLEVASPIPAVDLDRIQIEQVVLNLIRNGLEAGEGVAPPPTELLVQALVGEDGGVEVRVRDQGRGFDPKDAAGLFEPFFTTKKTGLGMGLSISQAIVDAHGGRIWGAPNEDRGATFGFSIPAALARGGGAAG